VDRPSHRGRGGYEGQGRGAAVGWGLGQCNGGAGPSDDASLPCPRVRVVRGAVGDVSTAGENRDIMHSGRVRVIEGAFGDVSTFPAVPKSGQAAAEEPGRSGRRRPRLRSVGVCQLLSFLAGPSCVSRAPPTGVPRCRLCAPSWPQGLSGPHSRPSSGYNRELVSRT
jgi:hypothetical protein